MEGGREFWSKHVHWLGLLVGAGFLVGHNVVLQPWTVDDAFISFRYADHFAAGIGMVYNAGEYVEGYTTFLWVFLLGIGRWAGIETLLLAKVLGLVFALGTLLLLAQAHRFVPGMTNKAAALAVVMTGTCGIFTAWTMSGMEVPLVAFLVLLSVLLHLRSRAVPERRWLCVAVGVCCALATMSRPEFGLLFLVLFADRLIDGIRNHNRAFVLFGLAFTLVYAPYFGWRYWYYGWLLPNTFYAKVGSTWAQVRRGAEYVQVFGYVAAFILVPVAAGVVCGARKYRSLGVLPAVLVVHTVYVLAVGGDPMPAFRFFSPVMPVWCLVAALSLAALSRRPLLVAALLTVIATFNVYQSAHHRAINQRIAKGRVGQRGKEIGLWLREYASPDAVLATNTAGALPYYSGLRVIDMLGLNDAHIAHLEIVDMGIGRAGHEKGDGEYVLSLEPDFIQFGSVLGSRQPYFRSDRELYEDPGFQMWYELKSHRLPSGLHLKLWERRAAPERGE